MKKVMIAIMALVASFSSYAWDSEVQSGVFVLTGCSVMQYDQSGISVLYRAYNESEGTIVWRENNEVVSKEHPERLKYGKLRVGQKIEFVEGGRAIKIIHDPEVKVDAIPCAAQGYK